MLSHVGNSAILGHFGTNAPASRAGRRIPRGNVPHEDLKNL
jgi:hypothetical protein